MHLVYMYIDGMIVYMYIYVYIHMSIHTYIHACCMLHYACKHTYIGKEPDSRAKIRSAWKLAMKEVRSDMLTSEATLILQRNIALTVASRHSESGQTGTLPDREIVSINIFNSGAANHDMPYPNDQFGTKISSRWASIVFAKAEDARDVIELYGGGGEQAVRFSSLFEKNILHLWPLYRIISDAAVPFPPSFPIFFSFCVIPCWEAGSVLSVARVLIPDSRSRAHTHRGSQYLTKGKKAADTGPALANRRV